MHKHSFARVYRLRLTVALLGMAAFLVFLSVALVASHVALQAGPAAEQYRLAAVVATVASVSGLLSIPASWLI
jgi:hypothetical protein